MKEDIPDKEGYETVSLKMVMPEDLNPAGRLFGGRLMEWIDEYAALYCMSKMKTRSLVTKKISEVIFNKPADVGDILNFRYRVKTTGRTSLTIECLVATQRMAAADIEKEIVHCDLVFVALDSTGHPTPHHYAAHATGEKNIGSGQ